MDIIIPRVRPPVLYWDNRKVCSQGQHPEAGLHVELAAEGSDVSAVNMLLVWKVWKMQDWGSCREHLRPASCDLVGVLVERSLKKPLQGTVKVKAQLQWRWYSQVRGFPLRGAEGVRCGGVLSPRGKLVDTAVYMEGWGYPSPLVTRLHNEPQMLDTGATRFGMFLAEFGFALIGPFLYCSTFSLLKQEWLLCAVRCWKTMVYFYFIGAHKLRDLGLLMSDCILHYENETGDKEWKAVA